MATVELSTGDVVAGSARPVYGLQRLLVLSFGIALGVEVGGLPTLPDTPEAVLGPWAPWVDVLVFGSLGASFLAAALVLPVCYSIQSRRSGPPVPVTFLPTFWLLVPGALGLEGVAGLQALRADRSSDVDLAQPVEGRTWSVGAVDAGTG